MTGMISTMAGAGEGIAVRQFLVLVQWIWLTLFLSLFMAWKSWMIRTYG
ncbi:hypothetical protein JZ785_14075 [Alicyclobacillus curvatus]|nr:hypothetical protein JZ785_14075 [Alicyclobacillus curvatus]